MSIYEKLTNLQNELKAPKGQYNGFGKYKYRSAEDVLESVKPLLKKYELTQFISDEIVLIGERYYLRATITLAYKDEKITVSAYARETETKKGMDESQVTGTASSYARKYALNGLYAIDDTKDADTNEYNAYNSKIEKKDIQANNKMKDVQINKVISLMNKYKISNEEMTKLIKSEFNKSNGSDLTSEEWDKLFLKLKEKIEYETK